MAYCCFLFFSCSVHKNKIQQLGAEVQVPFSKKNYPDTNELFYIISNAIGTNLNAVKSQAHCQSLYRTFPFRCNLMGHNKHP